ncbi:cytochrome B5-like protein [Silene latifolia]|uniref:cytochrome B5-like protein n=1 Tax=Silene latifolia TaxID=37657 RepID=UPI003D78A5DE
MEIVTVVGSLILGVLLLFLFIIPTFTNSSQSKTGHSNQTTKSAVKAPQKYTATEVSSHNKRTDCWVIIKDKVYDVTSYVEEHPGGDAILTNAGGDSTEGFYGPQHGTRVFDIIDDFCIGELEQ